LGRRRRASWLATRSAYVGRIVVARRRVEAAGSGVQGGGARRNSGIVAAPPRMAGDGSPESWIPHPPGIPRSLGADGAHEWRDAGRAGQANEGQANGRPCSPSLVGHSPVGLRQAFSVGPGGWTAAESRCAAPPIAGVNRPVAVERTHPSAVDGKTVHMHDFSVGQRRGGVGIRRCPLNRHWGRRVAPGLAPPISSTQYPPAVAVA